MDSHGPSGPSPARAVAPDMPPPLAAPVDARLRQAPPHRAARLVAQAATLGIAASVAVVLVGGFLAGEAADALDRTLVLTEESLGTVADSLRVAETTLGHVADGLRTAQFSADAMAGTFADATDLFANVGRLTTEDIPASLEEVQAAMPALGQATAAIDVALGALAGLPIGLEYNPDVPLAESVQRVASGLEGLPEELRAQSAAIDRTILSFEEMGQNADSIASDLAAISTGVDEALVLLGAYQVTAQDAQGLVEISRSDLDSQTTLAQVLVGAAGAALALAQLGTILLARAGARAVPRTLAAVVFAAPSGGL